MKPIYTQEIEIQRGGKKKRLFSVPEAAKMDNYPNMGFLHAKLESFYVCHMATKES